MKVRCGFVSNSSSSSFIVGTKVDLKLVTSENMRSYLKLPTDSPISYMAEEILKCVKNHADLVENVDEWIKDYYGDDDGVETYDEVILARKLASQGYFIYNGSFSSDGGDGKEYYLYENPISFETPDFVLHSDR